jgi:hypothetical protein
MIRITAVQLLFGCHSGSTAGASTKYPFVEYQCCAAISHLQHAVQIPNCQAANVAQRPNPALSEPRITLDYRSFSIWHASCSASARSFAKEFE